MPAWVLRSEENMAYLIGALLARSTHRPGGRRVILRPVRRDGRLDGCAPGRDRDLDAFHDRITTNPGVPAWWPAFCLAYDGVAAGYLPCSSCGGSTARALEPP